MDHRDDRAGHQAPERAHRHPRYAAHRYPPELVAYLQAHSRKIMFGTNYPMITPKQALAPLDDLNLDDETRHLFLHTNAERVFTL